MRNTVFLFLLLILIVGSYSAQRIVVGEMFTSTNCGYCPDANERLDTVSDYFGKYLAIIRYHPLFGAPTDPFYLRNELQSDYMAAIYGISAYPTLFFDFNAASTSDVDDMYYDCLDRFRTASDLTIDLRYNPVTMICTAEINVLAPIEGTNNRLMFTLVEDNLLYGGYTHNQIMRDIFPFNPDTSSGLVVDLTSIGVQTFEQEIDFSNVDVQDNCWIVVHIQNRAPGGGGALYQGAKEPVYQYGFELEKERKIVSHLESNVDDSQSLVLKNTKYNEDSYTVETSIDAPAAWTLTTSVGGEIFSGTTTVVLPGYDETSLTVNYNTNGISGFAKIDFSITSSELGGDPIVGKIWIYSGSNVLLVDSDNGAFYEDYYLSSIEHSDRIPYYYEKDEEGTPALDFMNNFEAIVWFTGTKWQNVLTEEDMTNISGFLDSGKNLFVTGMEIGYDLGGGAESDGTPVTAHPFYSGYLHAGFSLDVAASTDVYGVAGDEISDGIDFSISGGDGANNQDYPDVITAVGGADPIFSYGSVGDTNRAGIKYSGSYKICYLSFGFEGIDNETSRDNLMYNILTWFGVSLGITEKNLIAKPDLSIIEVAPNPFNSACRITFEKIENVGIFDIKGNLIDTVNKDQLFWMPKEDVPSGLYIISDLNGEKKVFQKITFIK